MTTDPKPCPFCGERLVREEYVIYVHPKGECILSGHHVHKRTMERWDKRADPPLMLENVEMYDPILEATLAAFEGVL